VLKRRTRNARLTPPTRPKIVLTAKQMIFMLEKRLKIAIIANCHLLTDE